jgi:hypothetical protein
VPHLWRVGVCSLATPALPAWADVWWMARTGEGVNTQILSEAQNERPEQTTAKLGREVYIPPIAKYAMDGAPRLLWRLIGEREKYGDSSLRSK